MKITVIDYGLSNLLSVQRAFAHLSVQVEVTNSRCRLEAADALVLPGVGAFCDGMKGLTSLYLADAIRDKCASGTPLLGICLGMQLLFDTSSEFGVHAGLGLIGGSVERIPPQDVQGQPQRVPHVGWSGLLPPEGQVAFGSPMLADIAANSEVYFVHSYEAKPADDACRAADTLYGGRRVCAAVQKENVWGCQFHPEKSGEVGLQILKNYVRFCEKSQ
jgi:glutamine amidotransferase